MPVFSVAGETVVKRRPPAPAGLHEGRSVCQPFARGAVSLLMWRGRQEPCRVFQRLESAEARTGTPRLCHEIAGGVWAGFSEIVCGRGAFRHGRIPLCRSGMNTSGLQYPYQSLPVGKSFVPLPDTCCRWRRQGIFSILIGKHVLREVIFQYNWNGGHGGGTKASMP